MKANAGEIASLYRLINGFKLSRMLGLVVDLGIADRIPVSRTVSAKSLAVESGVLSDPCCACSARWQVSTSLPCRRTTWSVTPDCPLC